MTVPPHEWATSTVGPSCSANARRVAATESASDVSGFCTAVTCKPAACRREMTSAQLEPSAHAPCTSTTLRASAGLSARADALAANSVAESKLTAITPTVRPVFFFDPWMYSLTALRRFSPTAILLFESYERAGASPQNVGIRPSNPFVHPAAFTGRGHQMLFGSAASEDRHSALVLSSGRRAGRCP